MNEEKISFWSKANFFSAYAFAGLVEGVSIGIGFGLTAGLITVAFN